MKAIVYDTYGGPDVLRLADIETPAPADDQLLIRVRAASVNPLDWHFMRGQPYAMRMMSGLGAPKDRRLGVDLAGVIEAAGPKVTKFEIGDEVFGVAHGAFAELVCAKETDVVRKPANVTFEDAASAPIAAMTTLQALRKARVEAGKTVLINGAAGGVGTFAVQIAKTYGAEVTGVCSTRNVDLVRSIGADRVIDYTREDFTKAADRYDAILDCIGNHSLRATARVLNRKGVYVQIGGPSGKWIAPMDRLFRMLALSPFVGPKLIMLLGRSSADDFAAIARLMESGKVKALIDRRYPLSEVPQAIAYVEEGHARGKVVITAYGSTRNPPAARPSP